MTPLDTPEGSATKVIRSAADLAVNGAAPLFKQPLHVGRPNIGNHERFLERARAILERQWLSNNGPVAQEFERAIADFLGVKHCVSMCNGTVALEIAIRALGMQGEVIVPSFTFVATAHALQWQAITPVFADIDPQTHNLDPDSVRRMITPRTSGILGVHLWGRASAVEPLQSIADEFDLKLMFDASHGFGCSHDGRLLGNFGDCEVFSFHATKFFNTFEGGAIVTNDDELAQKMRLMRNFGFVDYDKVIYPGTNGKLTEISAAMGLTNLQELDHFVAVNWRNYELYRKGLSGLRGITLLDYDQAERNNFQYIVALVDDDFRTTRDELVAILHAENVLARKYFWPGCHNMEPYKSHYPHAGLMLSNTRARCGSGRRPADWFDDHRVRCARDPVDPARGRGWMNDQAAAASLLATSRALGGFLPLRVPANGPATLLSRWLEGTQDAWFLHNARSALRALWNDAAPARIWLPAYVCPEVAEAVPEGVDVHYYPLDPALRPRVDYLDGRLRAADHVLAVDYFGRPAADPFRSLVRRHPDVGWIEDRAQALNTGQPAVGRLDPLQSPQAVWHPGWRDPRSSLEGAACAQPASSRRIRLRPAIDRAARRRG